MMIKFWLRRAVGFLHSMEPMNLHFGRCGRCKQSYRVLRDQHNTPYCPCSDEQRHLYYVKMYGCKESPSRFEDSCKGIFPLCEACWQELRTPARRMPYYTALMDLWANLDQGGCTSETRRSITESVERGL